MNQPIPPTLYLETLEGRNRFIHAKVVLVRQPGDGRVLRANLHMKSPGADSWSIPIELSHPPTAEEGVPV